MEKLEKEWGWVMDGVLKVEGFMGKGEEVLQQGEKW